MCNTESCTATVKFRRPYARAAETVRCSELDPEDRARYGCPACAQLSQQHNDFDALMAELESDSANTEELTAASTWVADTFYPKEGETLRIARGRGVTKADLAILESTLVKWFVGAVFAAVALAIVVGLCLVLQTK